MRAIISIILFAGSAFADCNLKHPIPLGSAELLKTPVMLEDAVFDQTPAFIRPENYDPKKNVLMVDLFNIELNKSLLNYIGIRIGVRGTLERIGFAGSYQGSFALSGSKSFNGTTTTYQTAETNTPMGIQHARGAATTEAIVKIEKGDITSIQLKVPVYKVSEKGHLGDTLAFTGKHQTLCLLEATLK